MGLLRWVKNQVRNSRTSITTSKQTPIPTFEQLEPRLLLDADIFPILEIQPLDIYENQSVIEMELIQGLGASEDRSQELEVRSQKIEDSEEILCNAESSSEQNIISLDLDSRLVAAKPQAKTRNHDVVSG